MEWLINNWFILVGLIAILMCVGFFIINFLGLPTKKQVEKIRQWLLIAVVEAEKQLGSSTGRLKLSMVYDAFIVKFPMTAKFIGFETFSSYVDLALEEMRKLLESNQAIKDYVEKE